MYDAASTLGGAAVDLELAIGRALVAAFQEDGGGIMARLWLSGREPNDVSASVAHAAAGGDVWFLAAAASSPLALDSPAWLTPVGDLTVAWNDDGESRLVWIGPSAPSRPMPFTSARELDSYLAHTGAVDVNAVTYSFTTEVSAHGFVEGAAAAGKLAIFDDGFVARLAGTTVVQYRGLTSVVPPGLDLAAGPSSLLRFLPWEYVAMATALQ